jgi:hypothetical protein
MLIAWFTEAPTCFATCCNGPPSVDKVMVPNRNNLSPDFIPATCAGLPSNISSIIAKAFNLSIFCCEDEEEEEEEKKHREQRGERGLETTTYRNY